MQGEKTTSPGVTRIDLNADGNGCREVWTSNETSPSVVPKLSLGSGLVYVYTNPPNQPLNGGDIVVTDAQTPATYTQCRQAGWVGYGYASHAQCISAVHDWARNKCIFERAAHGIVAFRSKYGFAPDQNHAMRHCVRNPISSGTPTVLRRSASRAHAAGRGWFRTRSAWRSPWTA